jgi:adenine-specific DNA-methyltransferase
MDEVFGRNNFVNSIAIRDSHPSGLKLASKNKKIIKTKSFMLVYKKSSDMRINPIYQPRDDWDNHYSIFFNSSKKPFVRESLKEVMVKNNIIPKSFKIDKASLKDKNFRKFCFENRNNIYQSTKELPKEAREESLKNKDQITLYYGNDNSINYAYNGRRLFPLSRSLQNTGLDGQTEEDFAKLICDFWDDVDFNNSQNEGGVKFPASKKPEFLIGRILTQFSNKNDIVLDSFLGSGTTAAVAHKMNRKFIGIEMGDHAYTHCYPRQKMVTDGEDEGGITKAVNWQGGGGFKFYELAPSLLNKNKYDNWVISKEYNADMLAASMAKQEGFTYAPDKDKHWKQGYSAEQDFIFTTTQFVTVELLDQLQDQLQEGESLLICAKKFQPECHNKFKNIVLKKIPKMLLGKCEFGKDDYSLNIINPPVLTEEELGDE